MCWSLLTAVTHTSCLSPSIELQASCICKSGNPDMWILIIRGVLLCAHLALTGIDKAVWLELGWRFVIHAHQHCTPYWDLLTSLFEYTDTCESAVKTDSGDGRDFRELEHGKGVASCASAPNARQHCMSGFARPPQFLKTSWKSGIFSLWFTSSL